MGNLQNKKGFCGRLPPGNRSKRLTEKKESKSTGSRQKMEKNGNDVVRPVKWGMVAQVSPTKKRASGG
jgi:hypothetical protein